MNTPILTSADPVLLVGGGACCPRRLREALVPGRKVVAADSGAGHLLALGRVPDAVIGDMDSISAEALARVPEAARHRIAEQDSTDFDKALRNIDAPLVIAHGFLGARLDHSLAVLSVLARRPERCCLLVGPEDAVALLPPETALDLPAGMRLSLWPLGPVTGRSAGLRWPIDGLAFAPDGRVGTSNAVSGPVRLWMDAPRMVILLPVEASDRLCGALLARHATWPPAAG